MGNEKRRYDKEYSTAFIDEVLWLRSRGIRYSWVYKNDYGISVWKYTKSYKLWESLAKMYKQKKYCFEPELKEGDIDEEVKFEGRHC